MKVWLACCGPEFSLLGVFASKDGAKRLCEQNADAVYGWEEEGPRNWKALLLEHEYDADPRLWVEAAEVEP